MMNKGDVIAGIHWNRDSYQMRAAVIDRPGQTVGAVIQFLCGQLNLFDRYGCNPEFSGVAVEHPCDGGAA